MFLSNSSFGSSRGDLLVIKLRVEHQGGHRTESWNLEFFFGWPTLKREEEKLSCGVYLRVLCEGKPS